MDGWKDVKDVEVMSQWSQWSLGVAPSPSHNPIMASMMASTMDCSFGESSSQRITTLSKHCDDIVTTIT